LKNQIANLSDKLESLHKELVATNPNRLSGEERLSEKVADIYSGIISYSGKPTDSQIAGLDLYSGVFNNYRQQLDKMINQDLPAINSALKNLGLEEIKVISKEEYDKS